MLQYKCGKLYYKNISIVIPENFYLFTNIGVDYDNGIAFIDENEDIVVEQFVCEMKGELKECFDYSVKEGGYCYIIPLEKIELNGILGFYCLYKNKREQYLQLRLDIGDGMELNCCIYSKKGQNIVDVMKQPFFKDIVEGIKRN